MSTFLVVALLAALAWPIGLMWWASSKIKHVPALSAAPSTAGTTYLIAGSDERDGTTNIEDDTEGHRSDTIMLLHEAPNGTTALVSIPRDSWVNIPGEGEGKINSAFSYGGPELLVETVEELSGLTVDHYVEVGMGGVIRVVDALDTVNLCFDYDVSDPLSEMEWEAGCHDVTGGEALAFSRMRYQDPEGDIGRAKRQRQVISQVVKKSASPQTLMNPLRQVSLADAAVNSLVTDPDTGIVGLGWMGLALRSATKAGLTGAPPISDIAMDTYQGSAVELDPDRTPQFFEKLRSGTIAKEDFQ